MTLVEYASIDSPLSLVTVADIVDKHFVPGPTERLKKIELRTFNKFVIQIRLDIMFFKVFSQPRSRAWEGG